MIFKQTGFSGLYTIEQEPFVDERGSFVRTYCRNDFKEQGIDFVPVQINRSFNKHRGTIRGMHYQSGSKEEAKVVQCLAGKIFDVVIDIRSDSPTLNKWFSIELSAENNLMLYIPIGFAHGFQILTDNVEVEYFMSEYYSPENSNGIRYSDPLINIQWPLEPTYISQKDLDWPLRNEK